MKYSQCTLHKKFNDKTLVMVSYIHEKFAKLNSVIKLKDENTGEWMNGWVVVQVGELVDGEDAPDYRQQIKAHRRATGDSLPRE